jgi:hypothetical protein
MCSNNSFSQVHRGDGYLVEARVIDGDTVPHINLRTVVIFPPKKFKSAREEKQYYALVKNVKKVYPYARLASIKLNQIHKHLETIEDPKEKEKYVEKADKALKAEFEDELKNLSMKQGRILIKLIDRETGSSTYDLIKELRGSLTAFMWQSVAKLFGSNLKANYDPDGEDAMIEEIVVRLQNGQL